MLICIRENQLLHNSIQYLCSHSKYYRAFSNGSEDQNLNNSFPRFLFLPFFEAQMFAIILDEIIKLGMTFEFLRS